MGKHRKNRRKRRQSDTSLTNFHIIAKARSGKFTTKNISLVEKRKHESYHIMFGLKTPNEVIEELVKHYWNGQVEWVKIALKNLEVKDELVAIE